MILFWLVVDGYIITLHGMLLIFSVVLGKLKFLLLLLYYFGRHSKNKERIEDLFRNFQLPF